MHNIGVSKVWYMAIPSELLVRIKFASNATFIKAAAQNADIV